MRHFIGQSCGWDVSRETFFVVILQDDDFGVIYFDKRVILKIIISGDFRVIFEKDNRQLVVRRLLLDIVDDIFYKIVFWVI